MTAGRLLRALIGLSVTALSTIVFAACGGGSESEERIPPETRQDVITEIKLVETTIETATKALSALLEGSEDSKCPRIDHITTLAAETTKTVFDAVDQFADAVMAELVRAASTDSDPPLLSAIDEFTDRMRDAAIDLQADLLRDAFEEDCERRRESLKERVAQFERNREGAIANIERATDTAQDERIKRVKAMGGFGLAKTDGPFILKPGSTIQVEQFDPTQSIEDWDKTPRFIVTLKQNPQAKEGLVLEIPEACERGRILTGGLCTIVDLQWSGSAHVTVTPGAFPYRITLTTGTR